MEGCSEAMTTGAQRAAVKNTYCCFLCPLCPTELKLLGVSRSPHPRGRCATHCAAICATSYTFWSVNTDVTLH